jgi:Phage major capsid protein E
MSNLLDVFSDDAFGLVALTDAINKIDHVPGRAGALTFAGNGVGVPTTDVNIEWRDQTLSIIPTSPRGAPAPKEIRDKAKMIKLSIPHVQIEDEVNAASIQNVRAFGSGDLIEGATTVVNEQMTKMVSRVDLTLESMRLGALKGRVLDADGTEILDLYSAFQVAEPDPITFPSGAASAGASLRTACQGVVRQMMKAAKTNVSPTALVYALCGDDFFDELVSHPDVTVAYQGYEAAQQRLAADYTGTAFVFGGIAFENYRGTDGVTGEEASDGELTGEVGIASGECRLFLTGVPGLYTEKFAPSDFLDTANTIGLPMYAKLVPDRMGRSVTIHVQSNPLPICLRPATLLKGVWG